jgi:hypothetical protein
MNNDRPGASLAYASLVCIIERHCPITANLEKTIKPRKSEMGKKSRLKRERRNEQTNLLKAMMSKHGTDTHHHEADFQRRGSQLCDLFVRYNAEDVAVALNVSDLWLPNISSQVKHHFAMGVFAAMSVERFTPSNRLDSYEEFGSFIKAVHAALPSFPSLEDYIPEPDWGEVRVACKGVFLNIFYGSSVERIPDFIEAFRLRHEGQIAALNDMDLVIALQDRLISSVRREVAGSAKDIDMGHVEIPSEAFWLQCRPALLSACDVLSLSINNISPALVLEVGNFTRPTTCSSFGDAVMNGTSLPGVMIRVGNRLIPLSLRNVASVVIDFWADRTGAAIQDAGLSRSVATFISLRLEDKSVFAGPLRLISHKVHLPHRFAAIVQTEQKFHFIVVLDVELLPTLAQIERDVHKLLESGEEWAVLLEERNEVIQFCRQDGTQPGAADIEILAVLSRVGTSGMSLPMPKANARVLSLPDFVTVFDSLDDVEELDRFWAYVDNNKPVLRFMASGPADLFGSFRDSNAVLVDGAIVPHMITLDPHWGSNWRYTVLSEFWAVAPPLFPDDTIAWKVEPKSDGLQRLIAKGQPKLAWTTSVDNCTMHVLFRFDEALGLHNGRLLELFVHCLADGFSQRRDVIEDLPLFRRSRIVFVCRACATTLATEIEDESTEQNTSKPLLSGWKLNNDRDASDLSVTVEVNLARLQSRLDSPIDASFEAECVSDAIAGTSSLIGLVLNPELVSRLLATSSKKPRFTLKRVNRTVDVPDFSIANIPTPEQYKIARRDLAVVLKNQGVEPGCYELSQAKVIIDPAKDELRVKIHNRIATFERQALLVFCIEQHDALIAEYHRDVFRVTQSLEHEVSYDRSEALAKAHDSFTREARNYRYLLECCLSVPEAGRVSVCAGEVTQLVATIDWLFVLYGASDVLHNDIDVAGMELDHWFIPQVFFSQNKEEKEREFAIEMANTNLGVDLLQEDKVVSTQEKDADWSTLDQVFITGLGFSFTHLTQMLLVLARWHSMGGEAELRLSYQASKSKIADILKASIQDLTDDEANRLIDFATLDPAQVRRLLGKAVDESDVPVWEHNKRGHRYNIRPLIDIGDDLLAWGAAAVDRTVHIWTGSVSNGYLPAEFDWPHVKNVVREIKAGIELQLEVRAFEVCSRATPWLLHGIDFKRKFPKERFEDVGDFDVLAYWPKTNQWLSVECKYNQPPFCLKDARRLRERIFGSGSNHGQFSKIERRRDFLVLQDDRLRKLLGWPEPDNGMLPIFSEAYVSRDIYWWMRNPPYEVSTYFVRIDGLDSWLRGQGFLVDALEK